MARFRMPAEWEPHEGTWIAWPHEKSDWPGKFPVIPWVYCDIVRHLARVERVHIIVSDEDAGERVRKMLVRSHVETDAVEFFVCLTDRSWTRDYCPIFVRDVKGKAVITDWQFNGWAKYKNWQVDDVVPEVIATQKGFRHVQPRLRRRRIVLEGGSIDVNGSGSMLTTEECLLSPVQQRNPGVSKQELESVFEEYLGVKHVIWLNRGIAGDDTHGHVDDLARFTDRSTVVIVTEENKSEENYAPLAENLRLLRKSKDQDGQPFRVIPLPMPAPVYFEGQRLPASYANFYIANRLVLVPTFNDANDRVALQALAKCFPDRQVAGIHCGDLVLGLGTLHCMTQQQIGVNDGP
jgi:agmatine deiminase